MARAAFNGWVRANVPTGTNWRDANPPKRVLEAYEAMNDTTRTDADCPKCHGSGKLPNGDRCLRCYGSGEESKTKGDAAKTEDDWKRDLAKAKTLGQSSKELDQLVKKWGERGTYLFEAGKRGDTTATVADAVSAFDALAEKVRGMTADAAALRGDAKIGERVSDPAGLARTYARMGRSLEDLAREFKNDAEGYKIAERAFRVANPDLSRDKNKRDDAAGPPRSIVNDGRLYVFRGNNRTGKDGIEYEYEHPANNGKLMKIWLTRGEANARADAETRADLGIGSYVNARHPDGRTKPGRVTGFEGKNDEKAVVAFRDGSTHVVDVREADYK